MSSATINTYPTINRDHEFWGKPLSLRTQAMRYPVVLLLCVVVLAVALNITTDRMPNPSQEKPLPDLGHDLIPKVSELEHATDALLAVLNVAILFMCWKLYLLHRKATGQTDAEALLPIRIPILSPLLFGVWEGHKDPHHDAYSRVNVHLHAWIRFWVTYSIMSLFRAPVIMLTSMPATDNHCQHPPTIVNPTENIVLTIVTLGSGSIHCGDLMFSGHSLSATLGFISLWTYGPMVWWVLRPLGATLMSLTWITILASRSHYTDDILVAIYLTIATYWLVPHNDYDGAPVSLQTVIRWWPCCGRRQLREDEVAEEQLSSSAAQADSIDVPLESCGSPTSPPYPLHLDPAQTE